MEQGMIYMGLSILASSILTLLFKVFTRYNIDTLQAIVINYFVCIITGTIVTGSFPIPADFWNQVWFPYALCLGFLFIVGFNIVAKTIQIFGVTIGAVAQKMSLIMSVTFAIFYYGESANWIKVLGIILALIAVVLTNLPSNKNEELISTEKQTKGLQYLVMLTLLISGIIEIIIQYVELRVESQSDSPSFIVFTFLTAGVLGLLYSLFQTFTGKMKWELKSLYGGIALGIPNYFSIYFLMMTLGFPGWEGSVVYPVNNVGIIGVSSILAWLLFKEKLSMLNILGVILAMIAILLIGFSTQILG